MDLGRKGVVWLDGRPIPVERTGAERAVARIAKPSGQRPARSQVVAASFGSPPEGRLFDPELPLGSDRYQPGGQHNSGRYPEPGGSVGTGAAGTLLVGGRRKKHSLAAIDRWYRREARERIESEVEVEANRLGLVPGKVSIRDQKTRWGSCSTSGTLSFNWRLVIGHYEALRYVVIHELVHITHHNHSPAFWSALTAAMPEWKRPAAWLKANERALTAYRPRL
jgi:YgjP-like, metallopeptidase domain